MSERDLRDMIASASRSCDKLFKRRGEIQPTWHAVTAKGENLFQPHPVMLDKDAAMELIRLWFNLMDVIRYVHVAQAWTALVDPAEIMRIDREGLANHPDRVEVVKIQGEDRDYGEIVGHHRIIRPAKGKPLCVGGYIERLDEMTDEGEHAAA